MGPNADVAADNSPCLSSAPFAISELQTYVVHLDIRGFIRDAGVTDLLLHRGCSAWQKLVDTKMHCSSADQRKARHLSFSDYAQLFQPVRFFKNHMSFSERHLNHKDICHWCPGTSRCQTKRLQTS